MLSEIKILSALTVKRLEVGQWSKKKRVKEEELKRKRETKKELKVRSRKFQRNCKL